MRLLISMFAWPSKIRWRVVAWNSLPIIAIMIVAWGGLMIILYVMSYVVEVQLHSGNPLLEQAFRLAVFGVLVSTWLYLWYRLTMWYRSTASHAE